MCWSDKGHDTRFSRKGGEDTSEFFDDRERCTETGYRHEFLPLDPLNTSTHRDCHDY